MRLDDESWMAGRRPTVVGCPGAQDAGPRCRKAERDLSARRGSRRRCQAMRSVDRDLSDLKSLSRAVEA